MPRNKKSILICKKMLSCRLSSKICSRNIAFCTFLYYWMYILRIVCIKHSHRLVRQCVSYPPNFVFRGYCIKDEIHIIADGACSSICGPFNSLSKCTVCFMYFVFALIDSYVFSLLLVDLSSSMDFETFIIMVC